MDRLLEDFSGAVHKALGNHLRQLVLFGSRARGDAHEGSDYDILALVDQRTPELDEKLLDIATRMLDEYGELFAVVLRSEEEWAKVQGFPLAMNIAREGKLL
jgi:predicted nucleotidyltransferase